MKAQGAYRQLETASQTSAFPVVPGNIIDCCCELLSSGRPFSEILAETKQLAAVTQGSQRSATPAVRLIIGHPRCPKAVAARALTYPAFKFIFAGIAALAAIIAFTAALPTVEGPAGSAEPLATAAIDPPSETSNGKDVPTGWELHNTAAKAVSSGTPAPVLAFGGLEATRISDARPSIKSQPDDVEATVFSARSRLPAPAVLVGVPHRGTVTSSADTKAAVTHRKPRNQTRYRRLDYPRLYTVPVGQYSPQNFTARPLDYTSAQVLGWGSGRFGPSPYSSN
jgi:hypothetical protein